MIEKGRPFDAWKTLALAVVLFCLIPSASLMAQRGRFAVRRPPRIARQNRAWRRARIAQDKHQHSAGFFKRMRDLPPAEQDRILRNDAQFHRLPPARQQQIRANLRRWNSLTPRQKQVMRQRQEIVQSLPPAERRYLRTTVFPEYNRLPPPQQRQVMNAFRRLRDMPPGQRQRFLSSPGFARRFSPQQQDVLRGLSNLLP
ncbi:MAG: DUF3106 domain-containing protein [Acidobacteriota bacterium]|nr:DUF3106 domain-containing protein [Acidobacteriota bacterium]